MKYRIVEIICKVTDAKSLEAFVEKPPSGIEITSIRAEDQEYDDTPTVQSRSINFKWELENKVKSDQSTEG